ncbi:MAG: ABC transporter permease [Puniceicoccaceae bacterium]|nr:MAG: ABC transporter permease [Puniceicoccaceae bacterium]
MRSLLTALGVIIGIVAVTLMGTAIRGIDRGFQDNLALLGTDLLYVQKWPWRDASADWWIFRNRPDIRTHYAEQVNALIRQTANSNLVAAVPTTSRNVNVLRDGRSVERVNCTGATSEFALLSVADMAEGRFFTESESRSGANVIVLGHDIARELFPHGTPIGETVRIRGLGYTVVGVYARQGSFLGLFSLDNQVVIPLAAMRRFHTADWGTDIRVQMRPGADLDTAREELTGIMRRVRGLGPGEPNNFEINESSIVAEDLGPITQGIAFAGIFITGLSLFVGAIGIMNITFVSVRERTREIGTRRALGARRRTILIQFLTEAVALCLIGGVIGLGLAGGLTWMASNAFPALPVAFSPDLVVIALVVAIGTGLFSGFAPAWQAARLDPATALRHE